MPPTLGLVPQLWFASLHTPSLQGFADALQSRGVPVQTPLLQASPTVQKSLSSQVVPSLFPRHGFESQAPPTQTLGAEQAEPVVPQTHAPLTQRSALGAVQGELQEPQCSELVETSTQLEPQSVFPPGQPRSGGGRSVLVPSVLVPSAVASSPGPSVGGVASRRPSPREGPLSRLAATQTPRAGSQTESGPQGFVEEQGRPAEDRGSTVQAPSATPSPRILPILATRTSRS